MRMLENRSSARPSRWRRLDGRRPPARSWRSQLERHGRARRRRAGAMPAMPVPVVAVVKKTIPIYLDYSARTESIRNVTLQAKVAGYLRSRSPPTAPTSRRATCSTGSIRAITRLRSTRRRRRRSATRGARLCALQSRPRHRARQERLPRQGHASTSAPARCARPRRRSPIDQAAVRTAELNLELYRDPRALPRPHRPQPGAGRHAGQRRAARCSTRWCSSIRSTSPSIRARPISPRSRRRARHGPVDADIFLPGETQPRHGQAHLPRQYRRPVRPARSPPGPRSPTATSAAARPICPRAPACRRTARRADGAADGARLEPARQISSMSSARATRSSSASFRSARPMATRWRS